MHTDLRGSKYFRVRTRNGVYPSLIDYYAYKHDVYVSVHARASSSHNAACIDSEDLARKFADFVRPVLIKRHGESTVVEVEPCQSSPSKALDKRIEKDSLIVRARIVTNNLAANKPVDLQAVLAGGG